MAGPALAAAAVRRRPAHAQDAPARDAPVLRVGVLQFGSVQWLLDVIRHDGLDRAHGIRIAPVLLANNDAGRIALMGGAADLIFADWLFAAAQRQAGTALSFAPLSSGAGGIVVPAASPVRGLGDLRGRRLGVAGGPADRSWLLVQAAARRTAGLDLATACTLAYGAPPLLNAKLEQGELDAVVTFWTFAARLQADGFRQAISVDDCARALGLAPPLGLLGFVFHTDWARQRRAAVDGLLAATAQAEQALRDGAPGADAAWGRLRPLLQVPEGAAGDALAARLRRAFTASIGVPPPARRRVLAEQVLAALRGAGDGGGVPTIATVPPDLFWPGDA